MIKKLVLLTLIPMTLTLQGTFVMKKGLPLTKIKHSTESTENSHISSNEGSTNKPIIPLNTDTLGQKIFTIDFNKRSVGIYTEAMHRQDFYTYQGENLYYENHDGTFMYGNNGPGQTLSIVKDGNEKVLRVLYKKGQIGTGTYPNKSTYTGFQSLAALPKKNRSKEDINNPKNVTLVYYVKFEDDFDWAIGGKLPGLAGGVAPAGGQILNSSKLNSGFSARFMWHMLGPKNNQKPGIIGYIYDPGRKGTNGKKIYGSGPILSTTQVAKAFNSRNHQSMLVLERNKWYKIQQTIKANRPNKSDATIKVWINDQLAADFSDIKLIQDGMHGKYSVDRFLFSTFYGGGEQKYAPVRNTHAHFKNINIYVK
jgi:hypothetical protein